MSVFSETELSYLLGERRLARLATVGADGTPHVAPVGWSYNAELDAIDIRGHNLEETKKYRDVARSGRAALVIDDIASVNPWHVRGVEVRGRADVLHDPRPVIRVHPERIVSWGLELPEVGNRSAQAARPFRDRGLAVTRGAAWGRRLKAPHRTDHGRS